MKNLISLGLAVAMLCGSQYADAKGCKVKTGEVSQSTGANLVYTEWDKLVTMFSISADGSEAKSLGNVSVLARGDEKFLVFQLKTSDYHAMPEQFAALEDPTWDPDHRDFLDVLLGDSVIFPAKSSLRLTLDDRSTVVLHTVNHRRIRADYTVPGAVPGARGSTEKKAKKLAGFLAKALEKAAAKDGWESVEDETSPHYFVRATARIEYPLDAETETLLKRAGVISARLESRDRYYTLGRPSTQYVTAWSKKSNYKIRDALACVDKAVNRSKG